VTGGRIVAALMIAGCAVSATTARIPAAGPALSSLVPHDVDTAGIPRTAEAMDAAFADFSWRSFVALTWPALADGTTDPRRTIGRNGDAPAVFERFTMAEDVFPAPPAVPAPWGSPPRIPAACAGATRVVSMITKAPATPGGVVREFAQALHTGPLIDQNRRYVRYAVQLNRDAFDFIVGNQLYDAARQDVKDAIVFPSGALDGRVGAITTKAAWKVLGAGDDRTRFHRLSAWVYTPAGEGVRESCTKQELGLVGLHIAHKTASRPQWIWSTFEQVDNVPPDNARTRATFFNPACSGSCEPNRLAPTPWDPSRPGTPTQVTRLNPLTPAPKAANPVWQAALRAVDARSPWPHYMLVDTQWPTQPELTDENGRPRPSIVANAVIETFVQNSDRGCIFCHRGASVVGSATTSDYSYLLLRANHASGTSRR